MIDRDPVLNKGFDKALALDDKEAKGVLDEKITNFAVTDDFIRKTIFWKSCRNDWTKRHVHDGKFITSM